MNWQTSKHQNEQKIIEFVPKIYTKEEGSSILILGIDDKNDEMNNNVLTYINPVILYLFKSVIFY